MILRDAIARTQAREISPPRQEIAATNASSHFGDLRGRSTCQAGNGPIDQTTAGLKVWRRATVKRPTLEKPPRRSAHRYRSYHARTSPRIRMWKHVVPFWEKRTSQRWIFVPAVFLKLFSISIYLWHILRIKFHFWIYWASAKVLMGFL